MIHINKGHDNKMNVAIVLLAIFMFPLEVGGQTCKIVVSKDNSGNFTTISEAINAVPNNNPHGCYIKVKDGVYEEYVTIPKRKINVQLVGEGMNNTILSGNRSQANGYGTDSSGTLTVKGQGFTAIDMTIQNVADPIVGQAAALVTEADHLTFYRCQFLGYQDTVYTKSGNHFFRDCVIKGTIDFICGDATAVLQNCTISVRKPSPHHFNTVTAQQRSTNTSNTGTVIHNCSIVSEPDFNISTTKTYLGRPWGHFSRTVVMQSFLDSLVHPQGWTVWSSSIDENVYYAEFNNTGPGSNYTGPGLESNTTKRVPWSRVIQAQEAEMFTVQNFIKGNTWIPKNVPYAPGLL